MNPPGDLTNLGDIGRVSFTPKQILSPVVKKSSGRWILPRLNFNFAKPAPDEAGYTDFHREEIVDQLANYFHKI